MTQTTEVGIVYPPVVLHTRPALEMNEEQFFEFCQLNRDWRIESTAEGNLEIMPPTGGETSYRNAEPTAQVQLWSRQDATRVAFDSHGVSSYQTARCAPRTSPGCVGSGWRTSPPSRSASSCPYARTS